MGIKSDFRRVFVWTVITGVIGIANVGAATQELGFMSDTCNPAVAADPNSGNFIIAYEGEDNQYDDEGTIFGTIVDPNAGLIRYYFELESIHYKDCTNPDIAANSGNRFAVVWECSDHINTEGEIYGRIYDGHGDPLTGEFIINGVTSGRQFEPKAATNDPNVVVAVWTSGQMTGGVYAWRVAGRLFNMSGTPLGPEFDIAAMPESGAPSVAMDRMGRFAVVWSCRPAGSTGYKVGLRLYNANGTPRTAATYLAEELPGRPSPSISMDTKGNFVVAWDGRPGSSTNNDIYARVFDPNGLQKTGTFVVNTYTTGSQELPSVSLSEKGYFVIAWQSENSDGNDYGICGRKYDPNNLPMGAEFPVNTYVYRKQHLPDVALKNDNQFFTVWQDEYLYCFVEDGRQYCFEYAAVKGRLGPRPDPNCTCLDADMSGNGQTNMADLAYLIDHWLEWGVQYDVYEDGRMNLVDMGAIGAHWMQCCNSPEYTETYKTACRSHLRMIGYGLTTYANDYDGEFPPALEELLSEGYLYSDFPSEAFTCPAICPHVNSNDYVYRGVDLDESYSAAMIVVHDKYQNHNGQWRNVLFVDGHVQGMTEAEFQAAVVQDNIIRVSRHLPQKPAQ